MLSKDIFIAADYAFSSLEIIHVAVRLVRETGKYKSGLSRLIHDDLHWLVIPSAVQTCCDSPSFSSPPSSKVPRRLLCASLPSSWSPASVICQMSSTVSSASSPQFLWDPCMFCCRTNSLEFTAWWSAGSSCWLRTVYAGPEDVSVCWTLEAFAHWRCYVMALNNIYLLT